MSDSVDMQSSRITPEGTSGIQVSKLEESKPGVFAADQCIRTCD